MLNIHDIIKKSRVNGHGTRYTIWVQGCDRRCPECFNPGTHSHNPNKVIDVRALIQDVLNTPGIDGITLSGGEPLLQAKELSILAKAVQGAGLTVMIFTGYSKMPSNPDVQKLLRYTDMVIAGKFDPTKPSKVPLIGSSNQRVIRPNNSKRIPNPLTDTTIPRSEVQRDGKKLRLIGFPTKEEAESFKARFGGE